MRSWPTVGAVESAVPPFAIGNTPETPVVKGIRGISAATKSLNDGITGRPVVGPA